MFVLYSAVSTKGSYVDNSAWTLLHTTASLKTLLCSLVVPPLATVALAASWVCSRPPEQGTSLHTACIHKPDLATLGNTHYLQLQHSNLANDASVTQANTASNNTVVSLHS